MRIGLYAPNLGSPAPSGVERCIGELVRALAAAGSDHEFVLFTDADLCPSSPRWRRVAIPSMGKFARLRFDHGGFAKVARSERLDLVHGLKSFVPADLDCPAVLSVYDVIFLRYPEYYPLLWRWYWRWALEGSVGRAAAVACISQTTARDVEEYLPASRGKTRSVPVGVDARPFEVAPARAAELRERLGVKEPYFLCVGNVTRRKNIPVLLEAFRQRRSPAGLVLAGAPEYGAEELRLDAEGVRYLARVTDEELGALYRGALALVYPSQYEGFGLPVLEAMALGCPVIASSGGALAEVAGEAALLVRPGSAAGLAEAMERLAGDRELRGRLSERGTLRASMFPWEKNAALTLELYESVGGRTREGAHETAPRP